MEIVPPAQRATSAAVMSWIGQISVLLFWVVAIGRFDEMKTMFGMPISGEKGLYWTVSIGMLVMILFLTLGIKETNPHSALLHEKFSFRNVFRGLFSEHLWPVYILAFSVAVLGSGLGAFNQLLITEQWGYTKQDQGTNIAVGGILNLFLIPLLGLLANKVGRATVYVWLVIIGIVINTGQYIYFHFILYDARPTLVELILFGEMLSIIGVLKGMSLTPLVYDFVPRNELGTYAAGSGLVGRFTGIITTNLMGWFVLGYSTFFLGPAGEMVRVTFQQDHHEDIVQSAMAKAAWTDTQTGQPLADPHITAEPWYATRAQLDHGRGYEIRLRNDDSKELRDRRDGLDTERSRHKARKTYALNQLKKSPSPAKAAALQAKADAELAAEQKLTAEIQQLEATLDQRAASFRAQVVTLLGDKLIRDGDQILGAAVEPASIALFPLRQRPLPSVVEKTLDQLHKSDEAVIDLRVTPKGDGWELALSARTEDAGRLQSALTAAATKSLQSAMAWPPPMPVLQPAKAIRLDLRIIEDPLDRHPSPVTRLVNRIVALVAEPATPERRLNALGRSLRRPGLFDHAGANLVPGDDHAVRLTVVTASSDEKLAAAPEPVARRLAELLGPDIAPTAGALYVAALPAAKEQRMTIAQPVVANAFSKQEYDYLAGYLGVLILQLVGLGITFHFLYLVKKGKVRRRGAEEAEAIA